MTIWSPLLTDPHFGSSRVPTGSPYWIGASGLSIALDTPQWIYTPLAGNHTTDVFDFYPGVGRDSVGNPGASAVTIGIDASWITNPMAAFPIPVSDPTAIPSPYLAKWAGGWEWAGTHGDLYRPSGLTVRFALVESPLSLTNVTPPPTLLWVDEDVTWTAGGTPNMQGPIYDPATRGARFGGSPIAVQWTPIPPTFPFLTIPIDYLEAHGYRVAVTVALDMDVPAVNDTGAFYELYHDSNGIGGVTFTYPQFRVSLTTLPALRQFPRNDALGGAPRQGNVNGSTSVQGSARQGWANTYR